MGVSRGAPSHGVIDEVERTFGIVVLEGYGLSETASTTTFSVSARRRRIYSVGKPIYGVEVQVWDAEGRALPWARARRRAGRARVNVMRGYHGHPEATAGGDGRGRFPTGDLGYVDEDGFFFVVDRKKDLIIRGGYNVYRARSRTSSTPGRRRGGGDRRAGRAARPGDQGGRRPATRRRRTRTS